jgi:23S rRNA (cytosine1962-C5)-methyltransferase
MPDQNLRDILFAALRARIDLFENTRNSALRLFNGFYEGYTGLAVDVYARTLVLHNYTAPPDISAQAILTAQHFFLENLDWINCVIVKHHTAEDPAAQRGELTYGQQPDQKVQEGGVWYAIDLRLNRDSSLYLDTRGLRSWAQQNLQGARVLNAFAYTGSLGVAALAGGAQNVLQLDRNKDFLNLAKTSYTLNGFPLRQRDFMVSDFFRGIARLKGSGQLFDCLFLDPPLYSITSGGTVDMLNESHRIINKVRPLVAHNGWLVAVNNALYLSGREFIGMLEGLAAHDYLSIERLIPVPPDFTGYAQTICSTSPVDPAPFNHPTKIALLRVRRKDAAV